MTKVWQLYDQLHMGFLNAVWNFIILSIDKLNSPFSSNYLVSKRLFERYYPDIINFGIKSSEFFISVPSNCTAILYATFAYRFKFSYETGLVSFASLLLELLSEPTCISYWGNCYNRNKLISSLWKILTYSWFH